MSCHHPAKYPDAVLAEATAMLRNALDHAVEPRTGYTVLDPFAGTGKGVGWLARDGFDAHGIELEPEWAARSPLVTVGNALDLPFDANTWDAVICSPTYGNRFADRDMRDSCAGTYMKSLQREASDGSSCHLQWGDAYRTFHEAAWREVWRVLRPGGVFLLNIKDHVRNRRPQPVSAWHALCCTEIGFRWTKARSIPAGGLRRGVNGTPFLHEWIFQFIKPQEED